MHRGAGTEIRPARIQRAQAQGGRHEPAGGSRAAQGDVPADRHGTRQGLRSRTGAASRLRPARLDEPHPPGGTRGLRTALSARGDPRRSPGPQSARLRALPAGGGAVQRAGHKRRRHRARRGSRSDDRAGVSRHPRGHAAGLPAPCIRGPGTRPGAQTAKAVLGRSRCRARHQASARRSLGRRARPAVRELGPDDATRPRRDAGALRGDRLLVAPPDAHRGRLRPAAGTGTAGHRGEGGEPLPHPSPGRPARIRRPPGGRSARARLHRPPLLPLRRRDRHLAGGALRIRAGSRAGRARDSGRSSKAPTSSPSRRETSCTCPRGPGTRWWCPRAGRSRMR